MERKNIGMGSDGSGGTVLKLTRMFRRTTDIDLSYCILRLRNAEKQGKGRTSENVFLAIPGNHFQFS